MTASRTTPTLCVLVIITGPSRNPVSSTQVVPVISPLPFSDHQPAKTGLLIESFPRGSTAVTPVRTGPLPTCSFPSPEIRVVCPAREYNLNESLLVLLPGRLCGFQQSRVFLHSFFEQHGLFARQFPILLFHGFREPRKFQVRIGVSGRIEKMLEPGPSRNAGRIEPVGFDLHQLFIQALNLFRRSCT